jgi:hypothetical protein
MASSYEKLKVLMISHENIPGGRTAAMKPVMIMIQSQNMVRAVCRGVKLVILESVNSMVGVVQLHWM